MNDNKGRSISLIATLLSVVAALIIFLGIYLMLGRVNLSFVDDGVELYSMSDVTVLSDISIPEGEIEEGVEFSYVSGGETKTFGDETEFKMHIVKTLLENLFTFKWEEIDHLIVLEAK